METEQAIKLERDLPDDTQKLPMAMNLEHFLEGNGRTEKPSPDLNEKQDMGMSSGCEIPEIKPYHCDVCGKRFKEVDTLDSHMITHKDQSTIVCSEFLEEIFGKDTNVEALKKKLELGKKKLKKVKPFLCTICGKGYSHKLTLVNHMKTHDEEQPFYCTICAQGFSRQNILMKHNEIHHSESPFACTTCGQIFTERDVFTRHLATHTDEKPRPYKCTTCSKAFTLRGTLERHMTTHTDEKPFSCSTCGKCFSLERALKGHMVIHTGVKAYNCTTCGQKFAHNASLRNHMRLHTGEKPFLCSTCGKTFVQQSSLSKHLLVHTGEKPHLCSFCGKGFKRNNHLTKHMRSKHKDVIYGDSTDGLWFSGTDQANGPNSPKEDDDDSEHEPESPKDGSFSEELMIPLEESTDNSKALLDSLGSNC
ncbi:unnamed protein product, partial [Meganyctiphanes norvegica]|uniref:C2H2-type domain-containing protein n=1 Tax=Meganyctiphanes norvegica TaxID=48144 RepID=A0AAV2S268_MEGNR